MEFLSLFSHFDPINAILLLAACVAAWTTFRNTQKWHTIWINKHEEACRERERILTKLTVLIESHSDRIDRLEEQMDRK